MNGIDVSHSLFTKIKLLLRNRSVMINICVTLLILLFLPIKNFCQPAPVATEHNIPVCCQVTAPENEFSGLTRWKNYVLLIPQHVAVNDIHHIIAIDTVSIDSVLQHQSDSIYKYITITLDTSLNAVIYSIQNSIDKYNKYGGFEAAVAVDDSLFFTVETDSLCYVVKGLIKIEKNGYRLYLNPKTSCLCKNQTTALRMPVLRV